MTFTADFAGAIVIEAAKYGYNGKPGIENKPKAAGLHTPEETADDVATTPTYFHNLFNRNASTTYFTAHVPHPGPLGPTHVFQMVPELAGAYGNAVEGKPYPEWADPNVNLNLQSISIEIEGRAHNIHLTMPRGGAQWNGTAALLADIWRRRPAVLPANTFGHYEVSNRRTDPGQLDIDALVADALALLGSAKESEDEMTQDEFNALFAAAVDRVGVPGLGGASLAVFLNAADNFIIDKVRETVVAKAEEIRDALAITPTLSIRDSDIDAIANRVVDIQAARLKE